MQGEMRRVLFDKSSTISEAVGRLVGVMHQQDLSKVSLKKIYIFLGEAGS
jgi:tRNA A-37 threonylcarbamoyl transferase component Bud32